MTFRKLHSHAFHNIFLVSRANTVEKIVKTVSKDFGPLQNLSGKRKFFRSRLGISRSVSKLTITDLLFWRHGPAQHERNCVKDVINDIDCGDDKQILIKSLPERDTRRLPRH